MPSGSSLASLSPGASRPDVREALRGPASVVTPEAERCEVDRVDRLVDDAADARGEELLLVAVQDGCRGRCVAQEIGFERRVGRITLLTGESCGGGELPVVGGNVEVGEVAVSLRPDRAAVEEEVERVGGVRVDGEPLEESEVEGCAAYTSSIVGPAAWYHDDLDADPDRLELCLDELPDREADVADVQHGPPAEPAGEPPRLRQVRGERVDVRVAETGVSRLEKLV